MHSTRVTFVVMNWGITNCAYRLMMRFFDILHGLFWLGPPIPYGKVANRRTASRSSWEHAPGYFNWIWCLFFCIVLHSIHVVLYAGNNDLI